MPPEQVEDADVDIIRFDPFSDVLFGLVAIVIPAIAIMLPLLRAAADAVPARDMRAAVAFVGSELTIEGRSADAFAAAAAGVRVRSQGDRLVPVDRILDDRGLALELGRLRQLDQPLLLLIEPEGQEAAFLLEAVAAVHGPRRIIQVRLDPACGFVRNPQLRDRCIAATYGATGRP